MSGDLLGQVVEVDPALHFLLQGGLQLGLLLLEFLKSYIVGGLGGLFRLDLGNLFLQGGDVVVDGLKLPLLLVAELQLLGAGGLLLGPLLSAGPGRLFPLRLCTGGQIV